MKSGNLLTGSLLIAIIVVSCKDTPKQTLFRQLSAEESGVRFSNDVHDRDSSHSFINEFGYMGGGVGIGDFNNDGLKDIFFSGNQVSCRLYLNKGDNKFEDRTKDAGLETRVWATGVSIADINSDGYDDIYLCVYGETLARRAKNLLFINQQNLTFKEQAQEYGLADTGYSTQSVFFDYDRDGDLDMYLANYLFTSNNTNTIFPRDRTGRSRANDRLYKNIGDSAGIGHPQFSDVTMEAGIKEDGYGLGVVASDFNNDGWPDIYVANDFVTNDELWLNNKNGTFTNCIDRAIQHQSYSSMGTDAADINNDGLSDIITLDMLPEYNERRKTSFFFMNYERYQSERSMGYEPEFVRNMLQLNNGSRMVGDTSVPFFSEIGQLAGVQATDWSWSALLADFDNDGWKDLHITNGIGRDFINADFLEYSNDIFNSSQSRQEQERSIRKKLASLEHVKLSNYLFLNNGNYTFSDVSDQAGITEASMSNGSAYADLDNDGDQDLVVNNINKEAFIFINNTNQKGKTLLNHYLSVQLRGDSLNKQGFGARVLVFGDGVLMQEQSPVRGYFSSVDQRLLFGLGKSARVDSLVVIWPDQTKQVVKEVKVDTILQVSWKKENEKYIPAPTKDASVFSDITSSAGIIYRHRDNAFNDFAIQRLLPQKYSQLGPYITTGDINNDGRKDFFVGGGFNFSGKIFTQQNDQAFTAENLIDTIKMEEDMDCLLFDADEDGDNDLLVSNGDIQYEENSEYYIPRLYVNDGKGKFALQRNAIPPTVSTIAGSVSASDYDGDGDLDLFLGGRVSKNYPVAPRSFLLQNNRGIFTDVTAKVCPSLQNVGMITAAVWTDFDKDRQTDLVVAGEWMPLRFFKNKKGIFEEVTASTGLTNMHGMWRSLVASDIDNDGDEDLVAGNLGLNCDYRVGPTEPMQVIAGDLDGNGSLDPVFFYFIKDKNGVRDLFPGISRNQFADQVPSIKKQFIFHKDYARATFDDVFKNKKENLVRLFCDETRTCYIENLGNGKFSKQPLPIEAQFAPVNAIISEDFDSDGFKDLLLAGNEYQTSVMTGRYDASYGCFLKGNKEKTFAAVTPLQSGFIVKGDVKDMALLQVSKSERIVLVALNNDSLRVFRTK
jgi:enediyne biosynthesis protein E4